MTRSVSMIVLAILLAQGPTSSKLQTFKDWTIGCDNVLRCEAQSLPPDGFHEIKVSVTRDAGPTAVLGQPSLVGLSAALRYMDAQQGLADTTTPIVA